MAYTIERANIGDEDTLAYIQTESWKQAFANILDPDTLVRCTNIERVVAMYQKRLKQRQGNGYILKVDGKPHAIAWWDATREQTMPGYAELICIHSLPDQWRKGYGTKLMDRLLADVSSAGYTKIMLWVFEKNTRARAFYEANGFVTKGMTKPDLVPIEICYERSISQGNGVQ